MTASKRVAKVTAPARLPAPSRAPFPASCPLPPSAFGGPGPAESLRPCPLPKDQWGCERACSFGGWEDMNGSVAGSLSCAGG